MFNSCEIFRLLFCYFVFSDWWYGRGMSAMSNVFLAFHLIANGVICFHALQNYIAPLEKLLNSDLMNCVQKKAADCESTVRKYGLFCMKLLRYCIEALSTERKQGNGRDHIVQEECFKCAELGTKIRNIFTLLYIYRLYKGNT